MEDLIRRLREGVRRLFEEDDAGDESGEVRQEIIKMRREFLAQIREEVSELDTVLSIMEASGRYQERKHRMLMRISRVLPGDVELLESSIQQSPFSQHRHPCCSCCLRCTQDLTYPEDHWQSFPSCFSDSC